MPIRAILLAGLAVGQLMAPDACAAVDGSYDTSWASGGRLAFPSDPLTPQNGSALFTMAFEADGNLLIAGQESPAGGIGSSPWWLGEMLADGTFVPTFGNSNGSGRITGCQFSPYAPACIGLAPVYATFQQGDGKILVSSPGQLTRTTGGAHLLDSSGVAGGTGYINPSFVVNNVQGGVTADQDVVVQPADGKVLAVGIGLASGIATAADFGVVRMNPDLSLDTTFNAVTNGLGVTFAGGQIIPFDLGSHNLDYARVVRLLADGRIVVVGLFNTSEDFTSHTLIYGLGVARLNADGSPDATFGGGTGKASMSWTGGGWVSNVLLPAAVVVDRAGNLTVALHMALTSPLNGMLVARMNADGSPDMNFGASGFAFNAAVAQCTTVPSVALALDSAGRVLVGGVCNSPGVAGFGLVRLRGDNGSVDTTFGNNGVSQGRFDATSTEDGASILILDPGGRLFVGGYSYPTAAGANNYWAGVARLTYDLIFTNGFETAPRGCLPPDCN